MELRGKQGLRQLPAKLFDESGNIIGEGCGQAALSTIQLSLKPDTKKVQAYLYLAKVRFVFHISHSDRYQPLAAPLDKAIAPTETVSVTRDAYPECLDTRKSTWFSEQAHSPTSLQKE